jgi:CheY-like chemotaxis protein
MAKILVVDDEAFVRAFLADALSDAGYEVVEVENGEDALSFLRRERPDCVLLDIILPGIDGLEVLKRLREKEQSMPVLIMTAEDPGWARRSCEKYGASGFLSKALDGERVVEMVENAILEAELA